MDDQTVTLCWSAKLLWMKVACGKGTGTLQEGQ